MWCTPASSYPEKWEQLQGTAFCCRMKVLRRLRRRKIPSFLRFWRSGREKCALPIFSGCSQGQSQKFYSFINTGVGGIKSLSDLHLEVCKYRMHRLSHSLNNYFVGRSTRCSYPTGLMNANWKNLLSFRSVGYPFLWLENDYLLLMGRDLSLGFDAPQWRSPE